MIYNLELKTKIPALYNGQLLIEYLAGRFTYKTKEEWIRLIDSGNIVFNGEKANRSSIVTADSCLCFVIPDYFEPDLDCDYHKIYENENIIVISKPANLPISSNHRFFKQNMTELIRQNECLPDINPIHRIDRETSGLLIYLKKKFDQPKKLRKDPRSIILDKFYLAIVKGKIEKKTFSINIPLKDYNNPPIGYKVIEAHEGEGKAASTDFFTLGISNEYSLLLAKLNSGRKHQIRVHCSLAGFPIIGDKLYSLDSKYYIKRYNNEELDENDYKELGAKHHLLHAYSLNLELPENQKIHLVSNFFSDEFKRYLKFFEPNILDQAEKITNNRFDNSF